MRVSAPLVAGLLTALLALPAVAQGVGGSHELPKNGQVPDAPANGGNAPAPGASEPGAAPAGAGNAGNNQGVPAAGGEAPPVAGVSPEVAPSPTPTPATTVITNEAGQVETTTVWLMPSASGLTLSSATAPAVSTNGRETLSNAANAAATDALTGSSIDSAASGAAGAEAPTSKKSSFPLGAIVGIAVGAVVIVVALAGFLFWRKRKARQTPGLTPLPGGSPGPEVAERGGAGLLTVPNAHAPTTRDGSTAALLGPTPVDAYRDLDYRLSARIPRASPDAAAVAAGRTAANTTAKPQPKVPFDTYRDQEYQYDSDGETVDTSRAGSPTSMTTHDLTEYYRDGAAPVTAGGPVPALPPNAASMGAGVSAGGPRKQSKGKRRMEGERPMGTAF